MDAIPGIIQLPRILEFCTLMISWPLVGWLSLTHLIVPHADSLPSNPDSRLVCLRLKISPPSSHFTERLAVRLHDPSS
jgi:hypothetical protein